MGMRLAAHLYHKGINEQLIIEHANYRSFKVLGPANFQVQSNMRFSILGNPVLHAFQRVIMCVP